MPIRGIHPNSKRSLVVKSKRRQRASGNAPPRRPMPEMALRSPDAEPCGKPGCRLVEYCWAHCRKNPKGNFKHELDPMRAGWAPGRGDGLFDVACRWCGEVGMVFVDIKSLDVEWGEGWAESTPNVPGQLRPPDVEGAPTQIDAAPATDPR